MGCKAVLEYRDSLSATLPTPASNRAQGSWLRDRQIVYQPIEIWGRAESHIFPVWDLKYHSNKSTISSGMNIYFA